MFSVDFIYLFIEGTEAEIQLPLKRFPDAVSLP